MANKNVKIKTYNGADTLLPITKAENVQGLAEALAEKQDELTAGQNITIENDTISATDTTYSAGSNIAINNNSISVSSGTATNGQLLTATGSGGASWGNLPYITTEPTEANTNGLIICVLSSEPSTKYSGYLYIITA